MRMLPRSLLGQMILLMGIALLVAQLVSLAFILSEQQKLNLAQNEGPALSRFAETARQLSAAHRTSGTWRLPAPSGSEYSIGRGGLVQQMALGRSAALEHRLGEALVSVGVRARTAHASSRVEVRQVSDGHHGGVQVSQEQKFAYLSAQLDDGVWLNARLAVARPDFWLVHRMIFATAILYAIVLGAGAWGAIRLARPLRELTQAAQGFHGRKEAAQLTPRGPADVRRAIEAFNAMNARVSDLLDQKDRMLGAIGHDLRTPLASMRIRAENMGPEGEREQLFTTLDDMAEMLEDILVLARTGRPREPVQRVDLGALADTVAEDFRALGHDVEVVPGPRQALAVQTSLVRRALRNLVENGCTHGGRVRIAVTAAEDGAAILVDDDGPGIPADRIEEVLKPFTRLDPARRRATGGAGLGLSIADAVARAHGGGLRLENRPEGGLRARLLLRGAEPDAGVGG